MANLNKVLLMGNLTRDPEMRYLPNGNPVCEIGMAINRFWTDPSGERKEKTCFVDASAFGRQAETLGRYMKKGRPLFIEGRLDFQSWETQEGQKRSKLKVIIENFQFLGGRDDASSNGEFGQGQSAARPAGRPAAAQPAASSYAAPAEAAAALDDDDIPF